MGNSPLMVLLSLILFFVDSFFILRLNAPFSICVRHIERILEAGPIIKAEYSEFNMISADALLITSSFPENAGREEHEWPICWWCTTVAVPTSALNLHCTPRALMANSGLEGGLFRSLLRLKARVLPHCRSWKKSVVG